MDKLTICDHNWVDLSGYYEQDSKCSKCKIMADTDVTELIDDLQEKLAELQRESEWVSVDDRLPEPKLELKDFNDMLDRAMVQVCLRANEKASKIQESFVSYHPQSKADEIYLNGLRQLGEITRANINLLMGDKDRACADGYVLRDLQ